MNVNVKSATEYYQTKYQTKINMLKGSYTTIKWDLSQGCKDGTISTNQLIRYHIIKKKRYIALSNLKIKITSSQEMQKMRFTGFQPTFMTKHSTNEK